MAVHPVDLVRAALHDGALAFAFLLVTRMGIGAVEANGPAAFSLMADYYPPESRIRAYYWYRIANNVGQIAGPLFGGLLAYWFGWRFPFLLFAVPTVIRAGCSPTKRSTRRIIGSSSPASLMTPKKRMANTNMPATGAILPIPATTYAGIAAVWPIATAAIKDTRISAATGDARSDRMSASRTAIDKAPAIASIVLPCPTVSEPCHDAASSSIHQR